MGIVSSKAMERSALSICNVIMTFLFNIAYIIHDCSHMHINMIHTHVQPVHTSYIHTCMKANTLLLCLPYTSLPLPPPQTMCSLVQGMLHCSCSAHPLVTSSAFTPSGPDGHTFSHSQAVWWYWYDTSHMWPPICGDMYSNTPELVSTCSEWKRFAHIMSDM